MSKATGYNWWKYSRYVYNIGRTSRHMAYSESERAAIGAFISGILESRPEIKYKVNLKNLDSSRTIMEQNDYAIGLALQMIGRNLKLYSLSTDEKSLCNALFRATGDRKIRKILPYVTISGTVVPSESGTITGLGSYPKGTEVELTAKAGEGHVFSKWEDESVEATRVITASEDIEVTATFESE